MGLKDIRGKEFKIGDMVIRAVIHRPSTPALGFTVVTNIDNDKLYLGDSKVAIRYPERLCIATKLFIEE